MVCCTSSGRRSRTPMRSIPGFRPAASHTCWKSSKRSNGCRRRSCSMIAIPMDCDGATHPAPSHGGHTLASVVPELTAEDLIARWRPVVRGAGLARTSEAWDRHAENIPLAIYELADEWRADPTLDGRRCELQEFIAA